MNSFQNFRKLIASILLFCLIAVSAVWVIDCGYDSGTSANNYNGNSNGNGNMNGNDNGNGHY